MSVAKKNPLWVSRGSHFRRVQGKKTLNIPLGKGRTSRVAWCGFRASAWLSLFNSLPNGKEGGKPPK